MECGFLMDRANTYFLAALRRALKSRVTVVSSPGISVQEHMLNSLNTISMCMCIHLTQK